MPYVEAGRKRLELIKQHPELRKNLWEIVHSLQSGLRERGFDIGETTSPVTPVFMQGLEGGLPEVTNMVRDLRENMGIFCSIIVYPVIPKGQIILRLIPTASHTLADVEKTLNAFDAMREKLDAGVYRADLAVTV
jgi:glycine C-acetyltransferase